MIFNIQRWSGLLCSAALPWCLSCSATTSAPKSAPEATASAQADETSVALTEENSPTKTAELGTFGLDLSTQNPDVKPGDDFFEFANGAWLKSYELKADESSYGSFSKLRDLSKERVKGIFEEVLSQDFEPGSIEQQLGDYYASFMAVDVLNTKGITPIEEDLAAIDQIADRAELAEAFGQNWRTRTQAPINFGVGPDAQNPDRMILNISQSGLGLGQRDYYLENAERFKTIRKAYENHIAKMLSFTGLPSPESDSAAKKILALETAIAEHHWPMTELRKPQKTNNPMKMAEFLERYPGYPWKKHFDAAKVDITRLEKLNVRTPSAIAPLTKLVKTTPLTTWKSYLKYHLINSHAPYLSQEIDAAHFEFLGKVLSGQTEQSERWERAVDHITNWRGRNLADAMGKLYVDRYFRPENKAKAEELVKNLYEALEQRITTLPWMGEETRREALAKLENFTTKIGHPKKWRDFSSIEIKPDDLVGNIRAVVAYWYQESLDDLNRPKDKDRWFMPPHSINAYYLPQNNEVAFPAAIFQPPFFDPNADPAVNYGAIGAVIGHEIGHGFDDQGSRYDAIGAQREWWTKEDRKKFEERAQVLVAQYAAYEPIEGQHVNGELTLGENIGDLGGLSMAYHAYKLSLGGKEAPVIDGLTGDQRFFLAWAQIWRGKTRDQAALIRLKSDVHSPFKFRVNGVIRNMDAWYEAFNVQDDNALYLAPEKRVKIW